MRNLILLAIGGVLLAAVVSLPSQGADVPRQASPGTLNYVEGQVSMAGQTLDAKSVGSAQLQPGESLTTRNGKAELLLTPGVFLRLGDNSSVEMISPSLTSTEVDLHQGEAMIEVAQIYPQNNLRVDEDGITTRLVKNGLYDFDANQNDVRVYKGEALVSVGDHVVKLKGGRQLALGDANGKAQKFDKDQFEASDLYQWASLRSSYVAEANVDAAAVCTGGGFYYPGWNWDPWFDAYTWIPGDGIFYSPFGWGYYSPFYVYDSPLFFGGYGYGYGRYYHHFGPNYRGWGPGPHYYGGFSGGHYHGGGYGQSGFGGAYHGGGGEVHGGGGGFHGGGAGGFHGGGGHGH
jgi:hypothetical protein